MGPAMHLVSFVVWILDLFQGDNLFSIAWDPPGRPQDEQLSTPEKGANEVTNGNKCLARLM